MGGGGGMSSSSDEGGENQCDANSHLPFVEAFKSVKSLKDVSWQWLEIFKFCYFVVVFVCYTG